MELAALEQAIRDVVSDVRLVKERHLRRLLTELNDQGDPQAYHLNRPHWFDRETVRAYGIFPDAVTNGGGTRLLLLVEPADRFVRGTPDATVLRHYWREVFRGGVYRAALDSGHNRWAELDEAVRVEAEHVLAEDHLISDRATPADRYAAFVAEFLTRLHFAEPPVADSFPSAESGCTLAVVRQDINDADHLSRSRPAGAPADPLCHHEDQSAPNPVVPAAAYPKLVNGATHAEAVRNDVRAALLHTKAALANPSEASRHRRAAMAAIVERLVPRLAAIREWDTATKARWASAIGAVLEPAAASYWSQVAKALYDLQAAAVELESDQHVIDPAGWVSTFGRRPLTRPLTLTRHTLLLRHLNTARKHVAKAGVPEPIRADLDALLASEITDEEAILHRQVEPILVRVLDEVGLIPSNGPEVVARAKLVAELVDLICTRGHLRMADLRDAIARNRLKLPDLTGPAEFFRGDPLLRADARLAELLDGIYHGGEIYLRWIQRFSAAAFGTRVGRFVTKYVALPFGGAVLTVEFSKYIAMEFRMLAGWIAGLVKEKATDAAPVEAVGELVAAPAGEHHHHSTLFTTGSMTAVVLLGLIFLGLIHVPRFRSACATALMWVGRGLRALVVTVPMAVWRLPPVRAVRNNLVTRVVADRFGWPIVTGFLLGSLLWLFGASLERSLRWGGGVALVFALVLNTPIGRRCQDHFEEALSDARRLLFVDLLPNTLAFILWVFRALLGAVDRWLYTIDEWFRFRPGQSRSSVVLKTALAVAWFPVAYVVRFAFYLLIEPQVNPLKHFPVVTVSHKLLLPMIPSLHQTTGFSIEWIASIVWCIPGIFGFVVWELKENWRLYAANRSPRLTPVPIGHHGETMRGLLRPGFHSGAIPAGFRKIRQAYRKAERSSDHPNTEKHRENLHHIEHALESFVRRELLALVRNATGGSVMVPDHTHVKLGPQLVRIELSEHDPAVIEFVRVDDRIRGRVVRPGFLDSLTPEDRAIWDRGIVGLMAMGAASDQPPLWQDWVREWGAG